MDDNTVMFVVYTTGLLAIAIMLVLRRLPGRGKRESARAICECEHPYAFHNPEDGRCSRLRKIESKWDGYGDPVAFEYIPCECHQYDGPMPQISPQIMRELTNPSVSVEPYSQDK